MIGKRAFQHGAHRSPFAARTLTSRPTGRLSLDGLRSPAHQIPCGACCSREMGERMDNCEALKRGVSVSRIESLEKELVLMLGCQQKLKNCIHLHWGGAVGLSSYRMLYTLVIPLGRKRTGKGWHLACAPSFSRRLAAQPPVADGAIKVTPEWEVNTVPCATRLASGTS